MTLDIPTYDKLIQARFPEYQWGEPLAVKRKHIRETHVIQSQTQ